MAMRALMPLTTLQRSYHLNNPTLFTQTGYEMVAEILKRQLNRPFDLKDVDIQLVYDLVPSNHPTNPDKERQPLDLAAHALVLPKFGEGLVSQMRIDIERVDLTRVLPDTLFFSGNAPMSFDDFAQYLYDRYHLSIEDGEFAAVMEDGDGVETVTLLTAAQLVDLDVSASRGYLVVQPCSTRFKPYSYIPFTYQPLGRSAELPLTLSATAHTGTRRLKWDLSAQGGTAPYIFSIVSPFTYIDDEGISQLAPGVTINGSTGEVDSIEQTAGNYIGQVQVIDAAGKVRILQLMMIIDALPTSDIIELNFPLYTISSTHRGELSLTELAARAPNVALPLTEEEIAYLDYIEVLEDELEGRVGVYGNSAEMSGTSEYRVYFFLTELAVTDITLRCYFNDPENPYRDIKYRNTPMRRSREAVLGNLFKQTEFSRYYSFRETGMWHSFEADPQQLLPGDGGGEDGEGEGGGDF